MDLSEQFLIDRYFNSLWRIRLHDHLQDLPTIYFFNFFKKGFSEDPFCPSSIHYFSLPNLKG